MNRFSVAGLCCIATLVGFAGARSLVAVDDKQSAADRVRQDFELMKLLADAYEQIDTNYVREIDRRELVNAAIRGMTSHLDQYSTYVPPNELSKFEQYLEQEFVGIGIQVQSVNGRLEVISPLPGSPAFLAGLKTGDIILEIDGKSTSGLSPAELGKQLAGPSGRTVMLGLRRQNSEVTEQVSVVRETIQLPTVIGMKRNEDQKWDFMLDDAKKVGYARITHFSRNTASELRTALETLEEQGMMSLVLDVRSNPGGLMESSVEIADMFLDAGTIVSMKGRTIKERTWKAKRGNTLTDVPIAVLVNRQSASASEVLSACLQDNNRAIVVGERSWGKGSVQNVIPVESGRSVLKLTTAAYFRPSGVNIHRFPESKKEDEWGVKPSDGHNVELSKEQWQQWLKAREVMDVIHGVKPDPSAAVFEDIQLNHALAALEKSESESSSGGIGKTDLPESDDKPNR